MSVRLIFIGLIVFLGLWFTVIALWLRGRLNKSSEYGMNGLVNDQTDTSRMKIGEIFSYIVMIVIVVLVVIKLMSIVGSGFASLGGMIVAIPVRAFFNARGRTKNSVLTLSIMALLFVFLFFWYILIGVPVKPPIMTIDGTKITLSKTSVDTLLDSGFDIYIMNNDDTYEYSEMLTSGSYTKYDRKQNLIVKKGDRRTGETLRGGAPYLLVKDEILIGAIDLYGSLDKDMDINDCRVINFYMDEDCKVAIKAANIDIKLGDINLLDALYTND